MCKKRAYGNPVVLKKAFISLFIAIFLYICALLDVDNEKVNIAAVIFSGISIQLSYYL
jgi:hypothetical protein